MANNATNQIRSDVHHVNCDGRTSTPSPVETPRQEVDLQPSQLVIPLRGLASGLLVPSTETSTISSTNTILNNIIRLLNNQNKVIEEKNRRTWEIWRRPEPKNYNEDPIPLDDQEVILLPNNTQGEEDQL